MLKFSPLCAALFLSVFSGSFTGLYAQTSTTGPVNVTVVDSTGATIPEASLELRNLETSDVRKGQTQSSGAYQFQALPFGTYRLIVSKPGFESSVFESVQVQTSCAVWMVISPTSSMLG